MNIIQACINFIHFSLKEQSVDIIQASIKVILPFIRLSLKGQSVELISARAFQLALFKGKSQQKSMFVFYIIRV